MDDIGVSPDQPISPSSYQASANSPMPPTPAAAAAATAATLSVTRHLQHAILQLCNEHVGYNHTLQVLGVLCVTVDDRPQEIVVKVNNTLKRVDALSTSGTPDNVVRISTGARSQQRTDAVCCSSSSSVLDSCAAAASAAGSPDDSERVCAGFGNDSRCLMSGRSNFASMGSVENLAAADGSNEHDGTSSPFPTTNAITSSQSGRKCHGRKQLNPVKVKHFDSEDEDATNSHKSPFARGGSVVDVTDGLLMQQTDSTSFSDADEESEGAAAAATIGHVTCAKLFCGSGKRSTNNAFSSDQRLRSSQVFRSSPGSHARSSTTTVRSMLMAKKGLSNITTGNTDGSPFNDSEITNRSGSAAPASLAFNSSSLVAPDELQQIVLGGQDRALNFSMNALDPVLQADNRAVEDLTPRSESSLAKDLANGAVDIVKIKEECLSGVPTPTPPPPPQPALQSSSSSSSYGMDFLLNAGNAAAAAAGSGAGLYDVSQLSQIMAAANYGTLIGSADGRFLPMSATGFDPHQLQAMMYRMSVIGGGQGTPVHSLPPLINCAAVAATAHGSTNECDATADTSAVAMDSATLNGEHQLPVTPLALARPRYTVSNQLNNGLTMHFSRTPGGIRRRRFGRHPVVGGSGQGPAKVKDIIMYDESAPLHAQRGSRIEGDFMLDALRADGKRRRRRTAEDTLTVEEIAEYMGSDGSGGGTPTSYQIACRYCGEVSSDLSRYFAHTLSSHGAYVCHQCGKSFTTKSSLLRHRPIHTGMRRFACSICRKEFYRKDKCKAHIKRHLGIADGSSAVAASAINCQLQLTPASVEQAAYHIDTINVAM